MAMSQNTIRPASYAMHVVCWAALLLVQGVGSRARCDELTADEALRRSKEAMNPPIRFRRVANGISSVISQKTLFDGRLATRVETWLPAPRIALTIGTSYTRMLWTVGD
jgi:hypothetical protein